MHDPTKGQWQEEARLLLVEFDDLPPMPFSAGYKWQKVYEILYMLAHEQQAPAAHLLIIQKAIRRANQEYTDVVLSRAYAWARLVLVTVGVASASSFALRVAGGG
ncbi:MAG: hypothetical protein F4045_11955 [Chloroflexi bacterium]|nr:hypothetical protein [Chloroflexota bacterium]MYK35781.1 hypothetical protein [Chloroflexota bacterium]